MTLTTESTIRPLTLRTLDYRGDASGERSDDDFRAEVFDALRADGLVVVRGFPADGVALVHFGRQLGELAPMVAEGETPSPDNPLDWLGNTESYKKRTFGQVLALHTAASQVPVTPQVHAMLMMHQGLEIEDQSVDNGQTTIARVDDAVRKLRADLGPEESERVLRLLTTAAVSTEHQFDYPQRNEPILYHNSDGSWHFRYWIYIVLLAQRAGLTGEQLDALMTFDAALNSPEVKFEVLLEAGDLIILDNLRVAHGRRPFQKEIVDDNGEKQFTSRRVYKIHVFTDL